MLGYHRGRVSDDCGPQRVGGMSNCAVARRRLCEKHVENPSTDSPVKDLTNMQLNMFLVCATGAFKPKTRTHRHGDVPQHHPQNHATCTPQACTFTDVSATTHKKACEGTSTRLSQQYNDKQISTNFQCTVQTNRKERS